MIKIETIRRNKRSKKGYLLPFPMKFKVFETETLTILECKKPRLTLFVKPAEDNETYIKSINTELLKMIKAGEITEEVTGPEVEL